MMSWLSEQIGKFGRLHLMSQKKEMTSKQPKPPQHLLPRQIRRGCPAGKRIPYDFNGACGAGLYPGRDLPRRDMGHRAWPTSRDLIGIMAFCGGLGLGVEPTAPYMFVRRDLPISFSNRDGCWNSSGRRGCGGHDFPVAFHRHCEARAPDRGWPLHGFAFRDLTAPAFCCPRQGSGNATTR